MVVGHRGRPPGMIDRHSEEEGDPQLVKGPNGQICWKGCLSVLRNIC